MTDQAGVGETRPNAATSLAIERTYLAHERTLMAWVRTSTSLISFGFSIQQFFRVARAGAPPDDRLIGPQEFGMLMMIVGLVALVIAVMQHRSDMQTLRARYPARDGYTPIPFSRAQLLAALIAFLGVVGLLSMSSRK